MDVSLSSRGYVTVISWMCQSHLMDVSMSSHGCIKVISWMCNSRLVDEPNNFSVNHCCPVEVWHGDGDMSVVWQVVGVVF